MARNTQSQRKAERPSYANKAVAPAARDSRYCRIRVVVAHDGLAVGEVYSKPTEVARTMVDLGYWEII